MMMRAFVVSLLVSMASGLVVTTQRPTVTQRQHRGAVKMIYGARNPTGPFAGAPCQVQWRVEAASESVTGVPFYITNGQDQVLNSANVLYDCPGVDQVCVGIDDGDTTAPPTPLQHRAPRTTTRPDHTPTPPYHHTTTPHTTAEPVLDQSAEQR